MSASSQISEAEPLLAANKSSSSNQSLIRSSDQLLATEDENFNDSSDTYVVNNAATPSSLGSSSPPVTSSSSFSLWVFIFKQKIVVSILLLLLTAASPIFFFELYIIPIRIQDGANAPGLIIDRIAIYNVTNKGVLFHLDASRPPDADIAPISVTKQASQFEIVANRIKKSDFYGNTCSDETIR